MANEVEFDDQQQPPDASGNGAAPPVDNFFDMSGIVDAEKAKAMNKTAHELKGIAEKGGFAINQHGLETYKALCNQFLDGYREHKRSLYILSENAPLGDFPYADAVASFNVKVADSDASSLMPNLELMADGYQTMLEVLEIARRNYNEADEEAKVCFAKLKQDNA